MQKRLFFALGEKCLRERRFSKLTAFLFSFFSFTVALFSREWQVAYRTEMSTIMVTAPAIHTHTHTHTHTHWYLRSSLTRGKHCLESIVLLSIHWPLVVNNDMTHPVERLLFTWAWWRQTGMHEVRPTCASLPPRSATLIPSCYSISHVLLIRFDISFFPVTSRFIPEIATHITCGCSAGMRGHKYTHHTYTDTVTLGWWMAATTAIGIL